MPINVDVAIGPAHYKGFRESQHVLVTSMFRTLQGEAPFTGHPAVFLRTAGCNYGKKNPYCNFCFPADKVISTPQGLRALRDLKPGDLLFTLDDKFNLTTTTIKKTLTRERTQDQMVQVTYEAASRFGGKVKRKTIVCTEDHPFHVKGKGFVPARDLALDDVIYHVKSNQIMSLMKKLNNPMHDPETSKRVHDNLRKQRKEGKFKAYKRTKWHRKNLSELRKIQNPMHSPSSVLKMLMTKDYKKSKLEEMVEEILGIVSPVKFKYTGNSKKRRHILGNAELGYARPDFRKGNKVIEVYDETFDYPHEGKRTVDNYEKPLRKFYKKLGFSVLFISQRTFGGRFSKSPAAVAKVGVKVNKFLTNGARVVGLEYVGNKQWSSQNLTSRNTLEVVNFSCYPHNTFIIDGLHVHNCDTAFQFAMGKKLHFSELSEQLAALYKPGDILVITGGEPTLQHALIDWIQYDSTPWEEVQFETNGTQFKFFQELDKSCLADHPTFVVSPKANTRTKVYPTVHEDVLRYARCLKFVLEPDPESPHHTIPEWAFDSGIPIYVSPAAYYLRTPTSEVASAWDHTLIDAEATARSYAYAAQYAMDHGLLLSIQTHLFAAVP